MMRRAGLLVLLLLAAPGALVAQGGGSGETGLHLGGRLGFDFQNDAPVVSAFLRAGTFGPISVQADAEIIALDGLTERQFGGIVFYSVGPGFRVGAGPVWRNTVFEPIDHPDLRETRLGHAFVALLGGAPRSGRIVAGVEFRYSSVAGLGQRTVALQLSTPLFGR